MFTIKYVYSRHMNLYVNSCVRIHLCIFVYMKADIYACTYIHLYITYMHGYTHEFIYAYIYMYIDMHGHILCVCMQLIHISDIHMYASTYVQVCIYAI